MRLFQYIFKNDELFLGDPGHTNINNTKYPKCTSIHEMSEYNNNNNITKTQKTERVTIDLTHSLLSRNTVAYRWWSTITRAQ